MDEYVSAEEMGMKATLDIKLMSPTASLPCPVPVHGGDMGFDLVLDRLIKVENGIELWGTGIAISPPTALGGLLVLRSSTPIKTGYILANGIGVIDAGYRGELCVQLFKINPNVPDLEYQTERRLVQLLLIPATLGPGNIKMRLLEELDTTSRGNGGFGSTDEVA